MMGSGSHLIFMEQFQSAEATAQLRKIQKRHCPPTERKSNSFTWQYYSQEKRKQLLIGP